MALSIQVEQLGGVPSIAVVELGGELDASNFERAIEAIAGAYAAGARALVLDLSGLSFMASSGLFAMHSAVRIMRGEAPPDPESGWGALHDVAGDDDSTGGRVRLCAVPEPVARVLERTRMTDLFRIDASRSDAVAALRGA
ncbi:MAG TPA: STAS domain-containing protein [Candidatus Limnocylindrales bacterium]|nr:STAS domain-containing protein [Candidatus Limnocylindrales bacterium]